METKEAAIDPNMPIVDPHHHLWDPRVQDKGWPVSPLVLKILYALHPSIMQKLLVLTQTPEVIKTFSPKFPFPMIYMENALLCDIKNLKQTSDAVEATNAEGHNVVATVYIECGWSDPKAESEAMKAIPEVGMAQGVADRTNNRVCMGIVGHVPLDEGADAVREALKQLKNRYPNFRGIRHPLAFREGLMKGLDNSTADKAYEQEFRAGFAVLKEFDLTFDTWLYQDNLPMLQDLALEFPETTIICDHIGQPVGLPPSDPKTSFKSWAPTIKELADRCPNVMVKLSGVGMAPVGLGFQNRAKPPSSTELAEAFKPYILHCIESFGVDRCMFASNFPVDKVSSSYTVLFNAFKIIVKDFTAEDKRKLFHDNAARIYRLKKLD